jgi:hypothetical protein
MSRWLAQFRARQDASHEVPACPVPQPEKPKKGENPPRGTEGATGDIRDFRDFRIIGADETPASGICAERLPHGPAAPNHDATEAEATTQHYAAPRGTDDRGGETEDFSQVDAWMRGADAPDAELRGLLNAAMKRPPGWADPAAVPDANTLCSCCDDRRWWADPLGWRCWTCHPPPPGVAIKEVRT